MTPATQFSGFKCRARKKASGNWVGYIEWHDNGLRLWTDSTTILRLSKIDALEDAIRMAQDRRMAIRLTDAAITGEPEPKRPASWTAEQFLVSVFAGQVGKTKTPQGTK